ncbi:unnamed protein product [Timema podura]|uniref:ATP synthase F0 subunit 8 n=1 Tax=Timema podura TaxID=61482 RepID=A0ABN7PCT4_TIMPD|nr:unnamed protein product [Timema podura]
MSLKAVLNYYLLFGFFLGMFFAQFYFSFEMLFVIRIISMFKKWIERRNNSTAAAVVESKTICKTHGKHIYEFEEMSRHFLERVRSDPRYRDYILSTAEIT